MKRVWWKPEYETGNPTIDGQHKELIRLAGAFFEAVEHGANLEVLDGMFKALFDYTATHFREEEIYWQSISSPHAASQKTRHARLTEDLEGIWSEADVFNQGATLAALDEWLMAGLIPHLAREDGTAAHAARND